MKRNLLLLAVLAALLSACQQAEGPLAVSSPDGRIKTSVFLLPDGTAAYHVAFNGQTVIDTSRLGFDFKDAPPLAAGLEMAGGARRSVDETWELPWGEQRQVRSQYNQLVVELKEQAAPGRSMRLVFRVFDDGLGFRYELPQAVSGNETIILDENTQFNLPSDPMCWWIPGDWDIYEHVYNTSRFSAIDALSKRGHPNLAQTYIPENAVNTPLTMKMDNGVYLSIHEAALIDYASMTLKVDQDRLLAQSELVGSDRLGWKVRREGPFHTPWRTIQIADRAGDLIESMLILNLNEPNKLGDVSWVKPMKYVGIWWEMHLGKSSWDYAGSQDMTSYIDPKTLRPTGRHGATTANAKRYIDFAAANGFGGLLVEGWNTGWERWIGFPDREGVFDFITPYPDYDLEEVVRYGKEKGVALIMHHETSAAPRTYDQQLDTAYQLMKRLGIHAVKTGYVGKIIPEGEYHQGQWMVNHFQRVLETAAAHQVAVDAHEGIKCTGLRRTYPNEIARETFRGQEFNAWATDGGNPTEHLTILPFTTMLAGPMDFTPGVFNLKLKPFKPANQVNTTLAHQLATYLVIYSPIQMACDLPEHYEGHEALQFIRDVGVDWEQTRVLDGEIGDFVTIAREERGTGNWFIGSLTDENARTVTVDLSFLPAGKTFDAVLYLDGPSAHWNDNPQDYKIETRQADRSTRLELTLAPGGGAAISLKAAK